MPAGIQIFNKPDRILQIDGNFQNLALVDRGVVTLNSVFHLGRYVDVIQTNCSRRTMAFRCAVPAAFSVTMSGSTWTYRFYALSGSAVTLEYFAFDEPFGSTNFGIQVFGNGKLAFDGGLPYLRVIDFVAGSLGYGSPIGGTSSAGIAKSYPGKNIAVVQCAFAVNTVYYLVPSKPPPYEDFLREMSFAMASTFSSFEARFVHRIILSDGPWEYWQDAAKPWQNGYAWLVVDVTNF